MTLFYRETDVVSGRWNQNVFTDLSAAQIDEIHWTLDSRITATQAMITASRGIVSITSSMGELTFNMSDSTSEGPFTLPVAALIGQDAWAPDTPYAVNDTFYINGTVYQVIFPDPGQSSFDAGANDGAGHNYFRVMVPNPGNALATGGIAGMVYTKTSSTDFAATWAFVNAIHVTFNPSTGSSLTSDNVAAALEELETLIHDEVDNAHDVIFTPSTGSTLTSTNVADALEELDTDLSSYLPLAGGTMSGPLTLDGDPLGLNGTIIGRLATTNTWALAQTFTVAPVFTDAAGTRTALGLVIGTNVQAFDADLSALAANSTNGLWAHTGAGTGSARTLQSGSGISVTNGDGVSGDPSIAQSANALIDTIEFVIDGGGATITTGSKGYIEVPFACTITRSTLLADQSGSVVVDIFKCTYAQFDAGSTHPVSGDKITASAPPTISSASKAQDSTLTGWTTAILAGDILAFNVNSVTTIQRVTVSLKVTHS